MNAITWQSRYVQKVTLVLIVIVVLYIQNSCMIMSKNMILLVREIIIKSYHKNLNRMRFNIFFGMILSAMIPSKNCTFTTIPLHGRDCFCKQDDINSFEKEVIIKL